MKVKDIQRLKPNGKPLVEQMEDRKACNSARNLVSYVNRTYPVEGCKYKTHITQDNVVVVTLTR